MRLTFVLALLFCCCRAAAGATTKPNIIFILVDDLGYGDFACFGDKDSPTPNIDKLAAGGTKFNRFYVASPVCSPSRCALITGQYPTRWNILSFISNRKHNQDRGMASALDERAPSLPRQLNKSGYATAHIGKWHLGGGRDVGDAPLVTQYGYDESLTQFEGLGDRILEKGNGLSDQSAALGRGRIQWVDKHEMTGLFVDRTIQFMAAHKDRPMFVNLWLGDVHDPYKPDPATVEKFRRPGRSEHQAKFYAVMDAMDAQIGRLVAEIDKLGLRERTMIIITGDNGPVASEKYFNEGATPPGFTAGLRGRKLSLYEGGMREPLIVNFPGTVPAGRTNDTTVIHAVDMLPSLSAIAGAAPPPDAKLDGQDLSAALLGQTSPVRTGPLFWHYIRRPDSFRESDKSPRLAVREGDWKLLMNADGTNLELYDLKRDRGEKADVARVHPDVVKSLRPKLEAWFTDVQADRSKHKETP